ncbi:MAG: spermidine/putrescine ABC transporter substrate-binding protein [Salinicola sp.]|uniref:polyamine ABC transporter substrate-binding protein n=1 Tax=Salinicola sp. TaxID=1978524 RepID=UPI001E12C17D|nr:spermidine/putrescine ABC transporter substrate-binding protein [Salinicola sp.]NRB54897.1 spermidine/putrescine ABC transporter substrate-binding protein [Salinicola sp.]
MKYANWVIAIAAGMIGSGAMADDQEKQLNLFNWTDYMDPGIIAAFEAETGIDVVQNYYNSNAEMLAKLNAGGDAQYDIIIPSDYFVPRLIGAKLIQPLVPEGQSQQGQALQGIDNIMSDFRHPAYDPEDIYTVPYQWGVTGIVYNTDTFPDPDPSWGLLYDPAVNADYPFALLKGDAQFTFSTICAYLGEGFDCVGQAPWVEAAKLVVATRERDNFVGFVDATATIEQIASGVIHAGIAYNGDLAGKQSEDPELYGNIGFFVPREGSQRWVDVMAIPARAPHPDNARRFIEYLLRPDVAAQLSNYNLYTSPNAAAQPMLSAELREPPVMPDADTRSRLSLTPSVDGEQLQLLQQLWSEARSR